MKRPDETTLWTQQGTGTLTVDRPVTLVYDNGEGLEFRRTISVDDKYLFTVRDEVFNQGRGAGDALSVRADLASRHAQARRAMTSCHEGLIGVSGRQVPAPETDFIFGLECHEESYKTIEDKKKITFDVTNAWLGFTDKYWATTLLPEPAAKLSAAFSFRPERHSRPTRPLTISMRVLSRSRRHRLDHDAPVRRRQGSRDRSTPTTRRSSSTASIC